MKIFALLVVALVNPQNIGMSAHLNGALGITIQEKNQYLQKASQHTSCGHQEDHPAACGRYGMDAREHNYISTAKRITRSPPNPPTMQQGGELSRISSLMKSALSNCPSYLLGGRTCSRASGRTNPYPAYRWLWEQMRSTEFQDSHSSVALPRQIVTRGCDPLHLQRPSVAQFDDWQVCEALPRQVIVEDLEQHSAASVCPVNDDRCITILCLHGQSRAGMKPGTFTELRNARQKYARVLSTDCHSEGYLIPFLPSFLVLPYLVKFLWLTTTGLESLGAKTSQLTILIRLRWWLKTTATFHVLLLKGASF